MNTDKVYPNLAFPDRKNTQKCGCHLYYFLTIFPLVVGILLVISLCCHIIFYTRHMEELQQQDSKHTTQVAILQEKNGILVTRNKELENIFLQREAQLEEFTNKLKSQLVSEREKVSMLKREQLVLGANAKEKEKCELALASNKGHIQDLQKEISSAKSAIKEKEDAVSRAKQELEQEKKEKEKVKEEVEALHKDIAEKDSRLNELKKICGEEM